MLRPSANVRTTAKGRQLTPDSVALAIEQQHDGTWALVVPGPGIMARVLIGGFATEGLAEQYAEARRQERRLDP